MLTQISGLVMKSRLNLKPGQKGTKNLVEKYGKALLYVRYRNDEDRGVRLKTVELVVEEIPWQPRSRHQDGDIVPVMVNFFRKGSASQAESGRRQVGSGSENLACGLWGHTWY